jgi:hypothetical protein
MSDVTFQIKEGYAKIEFGKFLITVSTEFPDYVEIEDTCNNAGIIVKSEEAVGVSVDIYPSHDFTASDPIAGTWVDHNEFDKENDDDDTESV